MALAFDAVLFDFDGVLADSEPIHHWAWSRLLAQFGVELPWAAYEERCIGQSLASIIERLAELSAGSVSIQALVDQYPRKAQTYRARMLEAPPVHAETIALLREISLPMAVVTSNAREEVEPILIAVDIRRHFLALVCREDVIRHKPAPDPYLLAARILNVQNPLVIEDSEAGCLAASAAGFQSLKIDDPRAVANAVQKKLVAD